MRLRAFGRALIALVTVAGLAALAGTTHAASATVAIDGFRFLPQTVTVNVGETVTWTNRDPAQHTATAAAFDTGVLAMGQSKTIQMSAAGTFEYRCGIHGAMTGTVRVVATLTPTPQTTRPPTAVPTVAPTPVGTPVPTTAPPTPSPTPPPTTVPPTASPTASPTPAATTPAQAVVARSSPSPRTDPPALTTAPPAHPDRGPGPMLAVVAGLLAAGFVGLGVYLARRR